MLTKSECYKNNKTSISYNNFITEQKNEKNYEIHLAKYVETIVVWNDNPNGYKRLKIMTQ